MVLDEREVKDDNIDQYIRDILELIKSQMPNGFLSKSARSSKCDPDQDCQTWGFHLWTHLKFPTSTFPTLSKNQPHRNYQYVFAIYHDHCPLKRGHH